MLATKKDGHTALHHVCENGNVDIVKLLIKYDARIKKRNTMANLRWNAQRTMAILRLLDT